MTSQSAPSVERACHEWLNTAMELVDWFEKRANLSPLERVTRSDELLWELAEHSKRCHAFREASNAFIALTAMDFRAFGIHVQPILDFLAGVDRQFDNLPTHLEDRKPLWILSHEARSTILAFEAASVRTPPRGDEKPDATASGTATPEAPAKLPDPVTLDAARAIPRGSLDEQAVIELKRNPAATYKQLAAALRCRPGTLRDKTKCPLLAQARAIIKAQRDAFQGSSAWRDRRPDDDDA